MGAVIRAWDYSWYAEQQRQARESLKSVSHDLINLPSNLMEIFKKHATLKVLGDSDFRMNFGCEYDEQFDLKFVSGVLDSFDQIGHGSFSRVYALPDSDYVLKVNCHCYQWSPQDGAFAWLRECLKLQSNPYIPKILALEQCGHLFISVVERLSHGVGLGFVDGSLGDLAFESYAPDFDVTEYCNTAEYPFAQFVKHSPAKAVEAARLFETFRDRSGGVSDCGPYNIMHRNGFPVLNDPICDVAEGCNLLDDGKSFSWKLGD